MTEEQLVAQREFDEARKKMLSSVTVAQGAIKAETVYAESYQRLVRVGLAPQIKSKYHPKQVAHSRRAGS
jgi:hypothetical protein